LSVTRPWRRYLLRGVQALGGLTIALFVVLALASFTQPGRNLTLRLGLSTLNRTIPGRVGVAELTELSLHAVELRRVEVHDPPGKRVLGLDRVRIELDLLGLTSGRLVVGRVELQGGSVDLRDLDRVDRGLVAAFVDPHALPRAPSARPLPYVRVDSIAVSDLSADLPVSAPWAPSRVTRVELRASFELDGKPRAEVEHLAFGFARGAEPLGTLRSLQLKLGRGKEPSSASLDADLVGLKIRLEVEGVAPPEPGWGRSPLRGRASVHGMTAERISRLLGDPSLKAAFLGTIEGELVAWGSPQDLECELRLNSAGGEVRLAAGLTDFDRLRYALSIPAFTPQKLLETAPPGRVEGRLTGRARLARAPASIPVTLEIKEAKLDGESLPMLRAEATLTQAGLEPLELSIEDAVSRVSAKGRVGFAGSTDLAVTARLEQDTLGRVAALFGAGGNARGQLRADARVLSDAAGTLQVTGRVAGRNLAFADISTHAVDLDLDLRGKPPELSGSAQGRITNLERGELKVRRLSLNLKGGPQRYQVALEADSSRGSAELRSELSLGAREVRVTARGRGEMAGYPVDLVVEPTRISYQGAVETEGIEVKVAGQRLRLGGRFAPQHGELVAQAEAIDVAALAGLLPRALKPSGTVSFRAELGGSPTRPAVSLLASAKNLRLGERPGIDLVAEGQLDASQGTGELKLVAEDHPSGDQSAAEFELGLEATSHFAVGLPLDQALGDAEYDARLDLRRLDTSFVQKMFPDRPLPVAGEVRARAHLRGRLAAPALDWRMDGELRPFGREQALTVNQALDYRDGRFGTHLTLADQRGPWIDLTAALSLGDGPPLVLLTQSPQGIWGDGNWTIDLTLAEREVSLLPLPKTLGKLPPVALRAELHAVHAPRTEPEVDLRWAMRQTAPIAELAHCQLTELSVDSALKLSRGWLTASLVGTDQRRELLRMEGSGNLRLAPALGGGKPELGKLSATAYAKELELGSVPYLCRRMQGKVSLRATLDDPLGATPELRLDLDAKQLSRGSRNQVDVHAAVLARSNQAKLSATVSAGDQHSKLLATVPVEFAQGRLKVSQQAPLQAEATLRHLPIAPFIPPAGPVSYASGTLSGHIEVGGVITQPRVKGQLELEQIALTATDFAQPLRQIGGRIDFTETELELDGHLDFSDLRRLSGDFTLRAQDFPLRQQGQVVATTNVDARFVTTVTPEKTSAKVLLKNVDTWLEGIELRHGIDLGGHPDLVVDGVPAIARTPPKDPGKSSSTDRSPSSGPTKDAKHDHAAERKSRPPGKPKPGARTLELVLDARHRFWVKRDDFAVKLSALLEARVEGESVWVEGQVDIDRGYLQLFGKVFDIQRGGSLKFTGSPRPDPVVDIQAVHENRRSGEQVQVKITGRGSSPELTFLVEGRAVTAGDAFLAIFGSQRSNQDSSSANDQAKNFVGGVTAGVLATAARRELGAAAPILMLEPGDTARQSRVRAGFELDSLVPPFLRRVITGVYFEGILANQGESRSQDANLQGGALLELYFPRDLYTSGQYGPGTTWSLDFGWQL
jgi:autotransporter translocation and assembly factor TamB